MTTRRDVLIGSSSALAGAAAHAAAAWDQASGGMAADTGVRTPQGVVITDHGASPDLSDNKTAIERAIALAARTGRCVFIPPGTFRVSTIDLGENDGTDPRRFVLAGPGTLHSAHRGHVLTARSGPFYDLVVDGPAFESVAGKGSTLFDGDRFRRLVIAPGTHIRSFDWVIRATDYLQTIRMIGVIVRGGAGAVVKARAAFDCVFSHNIIEFVTDGFVIDGDNDPALNRCSIDDNLIEGIGGRAIVLGGCIATSVSNNYFENNTGGDIALNAGTAPHKGLRVQGNAIQMPPAALAEGRFGIIWGRSTALPARAGGNFCNGNLHDTEGSTALIAMEGDFAAGQLYRGYDLHKAMNAPIGRASYSDGLTQHFAWFDREIVIDPHNTEIGFQGRFAAAGQARVLTFGAHSPQRDAAAFDRKSWTRGSIVFNAAPEPGGDAAWMCVRSGTPGVWTSLRLGT